MKNSKQTYQELTKVIKEELPFVKGNIQFYFYIEKKKYPNKYQRLYYDENGDKPYSKTLEDILFDFKMSNI